MDVLKFLQEGNIRVNPEYNPKTKKGKLQPQYLQDFDINNIPNAAVREGIASDLVRNNYNLNEYVGENFRDYDVFVNPNDNRKELELERAKNQSAFEQTGNALVQAVGNEILLGTVKGFSDIFDIAKTGTQSIIGYYNGRETTNDYTNPVTQQLEDWQDAIRDKFAIYQENPDNQLAFNDWGWWMSNLPSVATTVSLMIPSTAITKGISWFGRATKAGRKAAGLLSKGQAKLADKISRAGNRYGIKALENKYAINTALEQSGQVLGTAAMMRTQENYMEARSVYQNVYDNSLATIQNMNDKQRAEFFERNPEYAGMSDEDIAKDLAGIQATHTFWADYAMLTMDIVQLYGLKNLWTGLNRRSSTGGLTRMNREAAANMTAAGQEALQNMTKLRKFTNKLIDPLRKSGSVAWGEIGEGFEEAYQSTVAIMNEEDAKKRLDPTFKEKTISDFITDDEIINSAFWGWLGGVTFQAAGSGLGKLSKRIRNISDTSEEKQRTAEIESRATRLETLKQNLDRINQGIPINTDTNNPDNYDSVTGKLKNELTEEDKIVQKRKLIKEFAREVAIDANRVGNAQLLNDYMNDDNIAQYFKEQYGDVDGQAILMEVKQAIKDTNDKFDRLYYRMNELGLQNPFIKQLIAEQAIRNENDLDSYNQTISELEQQIAIELNDFNQNEGYNIIDDEELRNFYRHFIVNSRLVNDTDGIDKQIAELEKTYKAGSISEVEYQLQNKRLNKQIENLINLANPEYKGDRTKFAAQINNYLTNTAQYKNIDKENAALSRKIFTREVLKIQRDKLADTILRTDDQFKKAYKDVEEGLNTEKKVRIDNAIEQIANLMDKYDENEVVSYLYGKDSNNISDTDKKILDDNKIYLDINDIENGSENGIEFNTIKNLAKAARQLKDRKEAEARQVHVDNGSTTTVAIDATDNKVSEEIPTAPQEQDNNVDNSKPPVEGEPNPTLLSIPDAGQINIIDTAPVPGVPIPTPDEAALMEKETNLEEQLPTAEELAAINQFEEKELIEDPSFIINDFFLSKSRELKGSDKSRFITDNDYIANLKTEIAQQLKDAGYNITNEILETINKKYDTIAKAIRRRLENKGLLSTITGNEELLDILENDDFLYDYINSGRARITKTGKVYINITDFFNWLLNNKNYTPDIAYAIFNNIRDILTAYRDKIVPRGIRDFFKTNAETFINELKSRDKTLTKIDENVNISLSNNINVDDYNRAFNSLHEGDEIEAVIAGSGKTIQFVHKGIRPIQIGYLYIFSRHNTLNGYITHENGFYHVVYLDNGIYRDSVRDDIMNLLFPQNGTNELDGLIFDYYLAEKEDANKILEQFLSNDNFKSIIDKIQFNNKIISKDIDKARLLLNSLKSIIEYNDRANTNQDFIDSYRQWLQKVYNNYESTAKIADDIRNGKKNTYKVSKINKGIKNTTKEAKSFNNTNVNYINDAIKNPSTEERLQLAYVDSNGVITLPAQNGQDTTRLGFTRGHVMFRTLPSTDNYDYQKLYGTQLDSSNSMYQRVVDEINWLFNKRLDGDIDFDKLFTKFVGLFGGNLNSSNQHDAGQLFDGLRITKVTTNGNDSINIWGDINGKKVIIATMYRYKNKSDKNSFAISFLTNSGNYITFNKDKYIFNGREYKLENRDKINDYANFIASKLRFSQSYQLMNTLNPNVTSVNNPFVSLENGKFTIKFDHEDKGTTYSNFLDYITSNKGFYSYMSKDSNDSNYTEAIADKDDKTKLTHRGSLSIDVNAVTEGELTSRLDESARFVKDIEDNSIEYSKNVSKLINKLGLDNDTISYLDELNLIPSTIKFDKRIEAYGKFIVGRGIVLGKRWFESVSNKNRRINDGVRTIFHERIHQLMNERQWVEGERETFLNQILGVYNEFEDWYNNQDDTTKKTLKDFIDVVKNNKKGTAAEEFFIEAITNKRLAKVLNEIKTQDNIPANKDKTLWQKIVEFLSKLLGGVDIDANSLLGRINNIVGTLKNNVRPPVEGGQLAIDFSTSAEPVVNNETNDITKSPTQKANETIENIEEKQKEPIYTEDGELTDLVENKRKDDGIENATFTENDDVMIIDDEEASNISGTNNEFSYSNIYDATRLLEISNEAELIASQVLETTKFSC